MKIDYVPNLASVTHELVLEVAATNPKLFIKEGEINLSPILFFLGFYIDNNDYLKGIRIVKDIMVRDSKVPSKVYLTTVYTGKVRRVVTGVCEGRLVYDKEKFHPLKALYEKHEVLQPVNLDVSKVMFDIVDIGSVLYYNKD
jgi:hypothetical protein